MAIAVGYHHSVALLADGTVKAWGYNDRGQLGYGTSTDSLTPARVPGLTGVKAIVAGSNAPFARSGPNGAYALVLKWRPMIRSPRWGDRIFLYGSRRSARGIACGDACTAEANRGQTTPAGVRGRSKLYSPSLGGPHERAATR